MKKKKQEYIIAFGYGIKEKDFSNTYGDIRVLVAHPKNDGSYYTSTIKSNTGGVAKHYVRFLTKEDAQRYIDEKLESGYTYFKAKESRILKLLDSKYNMYIGGVTESVGVHPAEYNKDGDLITPRISSDNIDKDISKIVDSLINKEYYFNLSNSAVDKITEFFLSGLDIDVGWYGFNLGHHFYIKNITPNDEGINVDLNVDVDCHYLDFKETTTQMSLSKILDDSDAHTKNLIDSMLKEIHKDSQVQLNIFISYMDLKHSIRRIWKGGSNSPRFKSAVVRVIGQEVVDSILHSEPGSSNYQNVIDLRTKVRETTTKLISIARDYANTEVFIESYEDKNIGSVTEPTGYVKKDGLIIPGLNSDSIDRVICYILNKSIGKENYFYLESYLSESEVDKIIEFFLSGLDIDIGWKRGFQLCAPLSVKNITPNDDGINVDLLLKVHFPYSYFRETTTKMNMDTILSDPDENFNPRVNSIRNSKYYDLPFNIFISYTDLKDSIKDMWNGGSRNYTSFEFEILKLMGKTAVDSILNLKPGSINYQNLIDLRKKVREKTLEIISIIRDYNKTELFMESYKDKTVQDILHDLYEGKIK